MAVQPFVVAVLTSLLVVLLAWRLFRERPATRRLFVITCGAALLLIPAVCVTLELVWIVGIEVVVEPLPWASNTWTALFAIGGFMLCWRLASVVRERRIIKRLPELADPAVRVALADLAKAVGVQGPITVKRGRVTCATTLCGRVIVLPREYRNWDDATLRAVLAHELVHLRRLDDRWVLLLAAPVVVLWWLPWLRCLPRLLEAAVEESCDDLASFAVRSEGDYLHGVYCATGAARPVASVLGAALGGSPLVARFQRFERYRQQEIDSAGLYWAALGVVVALVASWSVRFEALETAPGADLRVVARTASGGDRAIELKLRDEPPAPLSAGRSGPGPPR